MPLLSGAMGARRYRVLGAPDPIDRDGMLELLAEHAFHEPPSAAKGGENHGWVSLHNLCVTEFTHEDCYVQQYLCFGLRMDRKAIPAKLLRALLDLRCKAWMDETGRERVPAAVKREIREQLELELFPRQLPTVSVQDVCWDLNTNLVWFFNNGNKANEIFRIHFARTFSVDTQPVGPLHLLADHRRADEWVPRIDSIGHSDYRASGDA